MKDASVSDTLVIRVAPKVGEEGENSSAAKSFRSAITAQGNHRGANEIDFQHQDGVETAFCSFLDQEKADMFAKSVGLTYGHQTVEMAL